MSQSKSTDTEELTTGDLNETEIAGGEASMEEIEPSTEEMEEATVLNEVGGCNSGKPDIGQNLGNY